MFELEVRPGESFSLRLGGKLLLCHTPEMPAIFLGRGDEAISMFRGNFDIRDRLCERIALRPLGCADGVLRLGHPALSGEYRLRFAEREGLLEIDGECDDAGWNRLWLRLYAEEKEHVVGGGEQFSALDLRGRLWPIWTREQGVGRNKLTEITRLADELDGSGGDYHTTFFPQPTLLSSRLYLAHLENYEYTELDLREPTYHEIGLWSTALRLVFAAGESFPALLEKLTALLGRQPLLPDWAMRGLWLGVQGGTERVTALEKRCRDAGVNISAVWIQDWEGRRVTSFGKRLQWDWRWNREMYPGLDEWIRNDAGVAWMGYINPYLVEGGVLFREAKEKGFF
ncbi:MAG: alpha-glucosidase, partial [Oscillospiraceae bacterium]|nr:alpha-glucosidase [Oscillospiraceae bacterium]